MDKYVIINKTTIQKRIEELENKRDNEHKKGHDKSALRYENTILELKQIISQSTPLIPEIEKAFDAAKIPYKYDTNMELNGFENSEHYMSNLKLDI